MFNIAKETQPESVKSIVPLSMLVVCVGEKCRFSHAYTCSTYLRNSLSLKVRLPPELLVPVPTKRTFR